MRVGRADERAAAASLPVQGAWIEISFVRWSRRMHGTSLPVQGAWIEIILRGASSCGIMSLPVQGAWIEIGTR